MDPSIGLNPIENRTQNELEPPNRVGNEPAEPIVPSPARFGHYLPPIAPCFCPIEKRNSQNRECWPNDVLFARNYGAGGVTVGVWG